MNTSEDGLLPARSAGLLRRLPVWTQPEHPLVAREMDALPHLVFRRYSTFGRVLFSLLFLLAPCALFTGTLPLQLLLIPLGWLPLIWTAPAISRERARRTWDALRLTPYSPREIVLAKLWAAAHRLRPLLGILLTGQYIALITSLLFLFIASASGGYRTIQGTWVPSGGVLTSDQRAALLLSSSAITALVLLFTMLDFGLNLALGLLASSLTLCQERALAGAFVLRLILLGFTLSAGMAAAGIITGQPVNPLLVFGAGIVAGPAGWPLLGIIAAPGRMILTTLIITGLEAALLAGAIRVVLWRADRL